MKNSPLFLLCVGLALWLGSENSTAMADDLKAGDPAPDFNLAGFNSPKLASALVVYDDRGWEVVTSTKVTMYRC